MSVLDPQHSAAATDPLSQCVLDTLGRALCDQGGADARVRAFDVTSAPPGLLITADTPRAQLCMFFGAGGHFAYARPMFADGSFGQISYYTPRRAAPRSATSYEARAAWAREVVPCLVAAARTHEDHP